MAMPGQAQPHAIFDQQIPQLRVLNHIPAVCRSFPSRKDIVVGKEENRFPTLFRIFQLLAQPLHRFL